MLDNNDTEGNSSKCITPSLHHKLFVKYSDSLLKMPSIIFAVEMFQQNQELKCTFLNFKGKREKENERA